MKIKNVTKTLSALSCLVLLMGCAHSSRKHHKFHLMKITHSEHRTETYKVRDTYRHPVETLSFFEVKPDMKVAEIGPGGGWYTEILGPYLKESGHLYLTLFSEESKRPYRVNPLNPGIFLSKSPA